MLGETMDPVGQPPLLRKLNNNAILEALRKHGPLSRADLARELELSKSTVSDVVSGLLRRGLVRELTAQPGGVGRRPTLLDIEAGAGYVVGIDLGGTLVRAGVADLKGEIRGRAAERTERAGLQPLLEQIARLARQATERAGIGWERVLTVSVGLPGAVQVDGPSPSPGVALRGAPSPMVVLCPNLPFLEGVDMASALRARLGREVLVENDVNLAAVGERWRGCAASVPSFAYIAIGTGVGMGLILNSEMYRGARGFAGELGYLPIPRPGPPGWAGLEELVSGTAIGLRWAQAAGGELARQAGGVQGGEAGAEPGGAPSGPELGAPQAMEAARRGDPRAQALLDSVSDALAWAVASLTAVVDVGLVVFGGGIGQNADLLLPRVKRRVAGMIPFSPELRVSTLGGEATLFGAIATALRKGRALSAEEAAVGPAQGSSVGLKGGLAGVQAVG